MSNNCKIAKIVLSLKRGGFMKKRYLLIITLVMFLLTGCSSKLSNINLNDLNEKMDKKESFVLYVYSQDDTLESTLSSVLDEYEFSAYKINVNKLNDEEKRELKLKFDYAEPSIIFIIEGKDPTVLAHVTDSNIRKSNLIDRLKNMEFIKEEK